MMLKAVDSAVSDSSFISDSLAAERQVFLTPQDMHAYSQKL